MYLSEASRWSRSTTSNPFQYHRPNAYTDRLKFSFFPRTIATWNGLTSEAVSDLRRQLMGLSPKYSDLGFGNGHDFDACPWGLLVNTCTFSCGGFVKDLYWLFFSLFLVTYVPHPHLPSSFCWWCWCCGVVQPLQAQQPFQAYNSCLDKIILISLICITVQRIHIIMYKFTCSHFRKHYQLHSAIQRLKFQLLVVYTSQIN